MTEEQAKEEIIKLQDDLTKAETKEEQAKIIGDLASLANILNEKNDLIVQKSWNTVRELLFKKVNSGLSQEEEQTKEHLIAVMLAGAFPSAEN